MTRHYGIIGHPLAHSLSPLVHNWGFSRFGIDARYEAWDTPPGELAAFMARLRELPVAGLSVTIPHKTAVMGYVDAVTDLGHEVGAVNTLFWRGGVLWAENTDVEGFCRPLVEAGDIAGTALILAPAARPGGGGGVKRLGLARVGPAGRIPEKAAAWPGIRLEVVDWAARADFSAGLVINATPMAWRRYEGLSAYPAEALRPGQVVYDLVYNPRVTRFVAEATRAGARVVAGLDMFLYQAVEQFRLWTGRGLPVEELRPLLEETLYGAA